MNRLNASYILLTGILLTSCNAYFKTSGTSYLTGFENKKNVDVMKIHTNEKGMVYFSERYPAKILEGEITGVRQFPLQLFEADSVVYKVRGSREIPIYVYSNGNKFNIFNEHHLDMVYTSTIIQIPLAEVSNMELKRDGKRSIVLTSLVVGISALSIYIISNMSVNIGDAF